MTEKKWLTLTEIAEIMAVTPQTARNWVNKSALKGYQFYKNGQIKVKTEDFERFLEDSEYVPYDLRKEKGYK